MRPCPSRVLLLRCFPQSAFLVLLISHPFAFSSFCFLVPLLSRLMLPGTSPTPPEKKVQQLSRCSVFLEPPASKTNWNFVMTTHRFYCPTLSHVPVSENKNVRFFVYPFHAFTVRAPNYEDVRATIYSPKRHRKHLHNASARDRKARVRTNGHMYAFLCVWA